MAGSKRMALFSWLRPRRTVIHYTGHRILADRKQSRFPVRREKEITRLIRSILRRERVSAGFGALASGADILFAEELLRRGAALHVVLAVDPERFVEVSVAEAGRGWIRRFHKVLDRAEHVTVLDVPDGGEIDFAAGTEKALDLAEDFVADASKCRPLQIAIHDGGKDSGDEGTGPDTRRAMARGWDHIVIRVSAGDPIRELDLKSS